MRRGAGERKRECKRREGKGKKENDFLASWKKAKGRRRRRRIRGGRVRNPKIWTEAESINNEVIITCKVCFCQSNLNNPFIIRVLVHK